MTSHPRQRIALLAACLAPLLAGAAVSTAKQPITHEALWMMKRVGTPVVSPDGRWVVVPVLEPAYEQDKEVSDLWLLAVDGSAAARRLTYTRAPEHGVAWSPDSHAIAFTTKREGDDVEQVYILDLVGGGEARRLTSVATGAANPRWRPDGKALLFESFVWPNALDDAANKKVIADRKARKYNVRIYEHAPIRFWNEWFDERHPTIMVQSLEEGARPQDILSPTAFARASGFYGTPTNENAITLAPIWSPDGQEIVFTATSERWNAVFAHVGYHLYRLPAAGGAEPRLVTAASGEYRDSAFAPDGRTLFYKYAPHDEEIYHLERLERLSWPAGGEPTQVTRELDREVAAYALTPDSRTVYLLVPEAAGENLYRVPAAGGTPERLIAPVVGGYTALVSARKAPQPVLIASYGSSVSPAEIVRIDPQGRRHVNLTHLNSAAAAALDWAPPEHFYFTSAKGRTIHNMIVRPPAFDAARKYPLLVLIHGGAAANNPDQIGLRWNYHLLAAPGYVVLMTDYTGSTGFGEKFAQAIKLDPLRTPADEINQAVDEALKRYAFIDPARMCAAGASYGGHLTNWLEATTTRYKCLISHAGEVDLTTQWGESDFSYEREVTNGGPPWGGSPIWREQSPISYGANWKTPMLLSIGERDFRVPIGNTLENWSTLQRLQVPSRLLVWPDAWHWILKPEDSRYFYQEVHTWLARYLKDETPATAAGQH
ncbi:MAG TPA: S9 family peptidase [Steroidobacteraceae bacterium]|jgi:dipeptidyl aminopeptidase/acylaminoacyl peptidase|nr:S9 family peptidase [Steroidobacteraceae bacterium]